MSITFEKLRDVFALMDQSLKIIVSTDNVYTLLKLFTVVFCHGWQGWELIET